MYTKILVPVDGSTPSELGLQHAILLAQDQGATLRLLHVVHDYVEADGLHGMVRSGDILKELRERGQTILNDAMGRARQHGVAVDTESVETAIGPVGAAITEAAQKWPADLIVIGTHRRRGIRRLVLGSDAEYVVRTATMPVLLVRGSAAPAGE